MCTPGVKSYTSCKSTMQCAENFVRSCFGLRCRWSLFLTFTRAEILTLPSTSSSVQPHESCFAGSQLFFIFTSIPSYSLLLPAFLVLHSNQIWAFCSRTTWNPTKGMFPLENSRYEINHLMWGQRVTSCLPGNYQRCRVAYIIVERLEQAEAVNSLLSAWGVECWSCLGTSSLPG